MKKILCIYHGNCDDGFGAAYAVWRRYGDDAEYYPAQYQKDPPNVTGRDVVMVDFCYKRPVMEEIIEKVDTLVLLDHHKSAKEDMAEVVAYWRSKIEAEVISKRIELYFDMQRSGAMMAWDYFHEGEPAPELIRYIQDRDLFTKQLPGIEEFTQALRSYPQDFRVWDSLKVDRLIEEGRHILRYYRQRLEEAKRNVRRMKIGGIDVPVVNASYSLASDLATELAENEPFAATFWISSDSVVFSLRSRSDGMDVSEIAKKYGGGGHPHAAGFSIPASMLDWGSYWFL